MLVFYLVSSVLSVETSEDLSICQTKAEFTPSSQTYEFTLPDLPYSHNQLQPIISISIVYAHHDHHHQTYVDKLNDFLEENPDYQDKTLVQLVEMASLETKLQKYAGGFYNHLLYWWVLDNELCVPEGPSGDLLQKIQENFGSFQEFKTAFTDASNGAFGSAWTWACVNEEGNIEVRVTENQINPLMGIDQSVCYPFFGNDLWEHAFYLQYLWERKIYVDNFWSIVDWDVVGLFYEEYASKKMAIPFAQT